jgi:hypothetical protein
LPLTVRVPVIVTSNPDTESRNRSPTPYAPTSIEFDNRTLLNKNLAFPVDGPR